MGQRPNVGAEAAEQNGNPVLWGLPSISSPSCHGWRSGGTATLWMDRHLHPPAGTVSCPCRVGHPAYQPANPNSIPCLCVRHLKKITHSGGVPQNQSLHYEQFRAFSESTGHLSLVREHSITSSHSLPPAQPLAATRLCPICRLTSPGPSRNSIQRCVAPGWLFARGRCCPDASMVPTVPGLCSLHSWIVLCCVDRPHLVCSVTEEHLAGVHC